MEEKEKREGCVWHYSGAPKIAPWRPGLQLGCHSDRTTGAINRLSAPNLVWLERGQREGETDRKRKSEEKKKDRGSGAREREREREEGGKGGEGPVRKREGKAKRTNERKNSSVFAKEGWGKKREGERDAQRDRKKHGGWFRNFLSPCAGLMFRNCAQNEQECYVFLLYKKQNVCRK